MLSGLTVALALVPEAVAFAFVAGVDPLVGLYGAFMMGLITAIVGGRPGMISGATGAMAVVMVALVATHGVQYLFAAVVLTGLIQIAAGTTTRQVHPHGAPPGDAGLRQRPGHRDLPGPAETVPGARRRR